MGSAGDPQRSSSPLKRRAEEFDMADTEDTQSDDVDMLTVPESSTEPEQDSVRIRGGSVDMLREPDHYNTDVRPSTENVPPIDEQIRTVQEIITKNNELPLKEGDKIYLVSKKWLSRVLSRGSDAKSSEDSEEIGPIDNSDITLEVLKDAEGADFVRLHPGLGGEHFEYFPEEAWNLVVSWYGVAANTSPIIRVAHNTNSDITGMEQFQYELYPPIFKLHRVWSAISPLPLPQKMKASQPEAPVLVSSQSEKLMSFLVRAKKELQIEVSTKVRIWRLLVTLPAESGTSLSKTQDEVEPEAPGVWRKLLVDSPSFTQLEKGIQREELSEAEDVSVNSKYNGKRTLAMAGLLGDEILVFEELVKESPTSNGIWLTALSGQDLSNVPARPLVPVKNPPTPTLTGPVTRGRTNRNGKGVVGLSNLGNTCYMNSALQCVKSVEELTKYFLVDAALQEINDDNPLGHGGEVAKAYSRLLHDIFRKDYNGSVRPGPFKNTVGRCAPQFGGYGQQDTQEFLGFLLDGLQEDLSRVKKKPYIEKPDSTDEMVNNPELIREMASKVWDITKKRDDSVIADLFTGMYKSTLVCPECSKVSITFDPFNNLTLQLPIKETFAHKVLFFPLNDVPVELMVDIDKNASFKNLKEFVGKRVDVPANRLIVIDQWNNKVYKLFEDSETPSEAINNNDKIHVYEIDAVPTNWPAPAKVAKKKKAKQAYGYNNSDDKDPVPHWDDPIAETILVPVIHRHGNSRSARKSFSNCLIPFYITLNRTEASDMNIIKRKILQRVATLTTYPALHEEDEDENENSDIVITSGSDADSSGDGKVVAKSVDGEDDVVDVTMGGGARENSNSYPLKKFKTRPPKFLDPTTFLDADLQNIFELSYYTESGEIVPSGWHSVPEDKALPRLSDRDYQLQADMRRAAEDEKYGLKKSRSGSVDSSINGSDHELPEISAVTRMNSELSSEEESEPSSSVVRVKSKRPTKFGTKNRKGGLKTYGRQGKQKSNKFTDRLGRRVSEESSEPAGPIVRLGEGICVEWYYNAYDDIFQGCKDDTNRGTSTFDKVEYLQDPALERLTKARQLRKRNGVTLDECLDEFQREEILSEMDTWYCPRCKEHRRASKKFELWKTPDILIIHLKRFSSLSSHRAKLDALVDFPIENLDVSSRVIETEPGKQEVYDLFAVDNHMGGLGGGHYTAYAKSFVDHQWYNYNDAMVNKVKPESVVSSSAYLLFYRRRSEVPLGGPRFQEIIAKYDYPDEEQSSANESGEDQRLDANSSQRGSSSALTGAEVVRRRGGSLTGIQTTMEMSQDPPAYQEEMENDSIPLLLKDSAHNDVFDDEGVVLEDAAQQHSIPVFQNSWSFATLDAQPRRNSNASSSGGSDAVANGSELGAQDMQDRAHEFDFAPVDEDYVEDQADAPPDIDMDENGDRAFAADVLSNNIHMIQTQAPEEEEADDEKVDEIHV